MGRTDTLEVWVSMASLAPVNKLMDSERVQVGFDDRGASSPQELASVIASIAGGLGCRAAVMRALVHRNKHRWVTFVVDYVTFEMKGMRQGEMEALVDLAFESSARAQRDIESPYREKLPGCGR